MKKLWNMDLFRSALIFIAITLVLAIISSFAKGLAKPPLVLCTIAMAFVAVVFIASTIKEFRKNTSD